MPSSRHSRRVSGNRAQLSEPDDILTADRASVRAERVAVFGKTKMCKFFILGVCTKGSECAFAHDPAEMMPVPDLSRTKICKSLINTGSCEDPDCKYAHNKDELRNVPGVLLMPKGIPSTATTSSTRQQASSHGGGTRDQKTKPKPKLNESTAGQPPIFAGQRPQTVPAAQTVDMQAMMSGMAMHLAQMQMMVAAQSQDTSAKTRAKAAATSSPFLYNALFPAYDGQQQDPRRAAVKQGKAPGSRSTSNKQLGSRPTPNEEAMGSVPYDVKNTFIDVPLASTNSSIGMRNVQSAAACLYAMDGEDTPQQVAEDESAPYFPDFAPALPPFSMSDTVLEPSSLGPLKSMPRLNTCGSDLDALAEEETDDPDVSDSAFSSVPFSMQVSDVSSSYSRSEKRLQDTPFVDAQEAEVRARAGSSDESRGGEDMSSITSISVKNTFIEFKQKPEWSMLRQVQSAAGGLDLLSLE